MILIVTGALRMVHLKRGLEELKIGGLIKTIVKISQITEKSPGKLKKLALTQTLVEYHQLILV